ncbi:hypothetical protein B0T16DRAFT_320225 [Cercophora newfieldiana]|uniref:F-box domain-containing protein n=1 Tax=Cercophora newfieldiana TaxID=92897 RepID=A0AA39YPR0_9PEZI|nr:hypothetical protein B0T16DRAFT_320225 [Cercophora newfieldiana]
MDHLHVTEFGSDRYLTKLNQASQAANANATTTATTSTTEIAQTQSPFILPIRGYIPESEDPAIKTNESKRPEKRSFLGFRSKFHSSKDSKGPPAATQTTELVYRDRRPSVASTTKQSVPFDVLFQGLPNELQVEIIASLPLSDVLNLRLASRSLHALVSFNETPISRYHLDHHIPTYAKRLYPVPEGAALNFHYLCGLWHRLHVAAKLSYLMCEWITKELFLRNTEEKKREFAPQKERMRRRLIPVLFTVFHFFETYRKLHAKYVSENGGHGLRHEPYTVNPIEAEVMSMYDDRTLLRVHEAFPLILSSFCRRLRPPTYVGRVERSLRGYLREKPPDEVHVAILCIGGLREVERIWEVKGYNTRRATVDNWYNSITRDTTEPEPEQEPKKRRGLLGLKRKKSLAVLGKAPVTEPFRVNEMNVRNGDAAQNFVFNTSLSAGMPMGPLSKDELKTLLPDLPELQRIWKETAEAMILDRKIIERPSDIRRNAHLLTDLIKEDGVEEEDQWWYGTIAPESVRPNLDAIEEDALE